MSKLDNTATLPDLIEGTVRLSEDDARLKIDAYIDRLSDIPPDPHAGANIIQFYELVQDAIRSREATEELPEDKRLLVLADDPPENIDTEAITFVLKLREPGQISQGSPGDNGPKELVSHFRSTQQHPEHIGEQLVTMGKYYDNWVTFYIYARNKATALKRVLWFEDVMGTFSWYFRLHFVRAIEMSVGAPEEITISDLELVRYPMTFFVRTEHIYQFGSQELRRLVLSIAIENGEED